MDQKCLDEWGKKNLHRDCDETDCSYYKPINMEIESLRIKCSDCIQNKICKEPEIAINHFETE